MTNQEIEQLVDKYIDGVATESERKMLLEWYRVNLQEDTVWLSDNPNERQEVKDRMKARMQAAVANSATSLRSTKDSSIKRNAWIAAAVAVFVSISLWIGLKKNESVDQGQSLYVSHQASADTTENRYVNLPDSSVVILRYGASLEMISDFSGNTREVRLVGEGYFDIKRDESKPFIVYAGDIKTVVLGTAFTIKSGKDGKQVQVTVQRGKVRVEQKKKILSELIANQQFGIDIDAATTTQQPVHADEELVWTAADLDFEEMPFGELAGRLSRRYGVAITFKNDALSGCPMTGMFKGTEKIDDVLSTLCAVRNASFKKLADGSFVIDGKGCN